ncbi:MAG: hypothetical protein FWH20_06425 [Oscillospiraceae bacterium]|nr:hypothetical protein [Oscillospiraceae bacterium]
MANFFTNWWNRTKAQYNMQKYLGERTAATAKYMAHQDAKFREIEQQGMDGYDTAIAKYAFRRSEENRNLTTGIPEVAAIGAAHGEITAITMDMSDEDRQALGTNPEGSGVGAFFGRLFNGRFFQSSRDEDARIRRRFQTDALYDAYNAPSQVYKLAERETEIRNGLLSADFVVSNRHNVPGANDTDVYVGRATAVLNAHDTAVQKQHIANNLEPEEIGLDVINPALDQQQKAAQAAQVRAQARQQRLTEGQPDRDIIQRTFVQAKLDDKARLAADNEAFFGTHKNEDFAGVYAKLGLESLEHRMPSRVGFARMYMLSKGFTMDEIMDVSEAGLDKKRRVGAELDKILFGDDKEFSKKALTEMAEKSVKILADPNTFPKFDITSDQSIVANYAKTTTFISMTKNLEQVMLYEPPKNTVNEHKAGILAKMPKDFTAYMTNKGNFEQGCGQLIEARVATIFSDDYSKTKNTMGLDTKTMEDIRNPFTKKPPALQSHANEVRNLINANYNGSLTDPKVVKILYGQFTGQSTKDYMDTYNALPANEKKELDELAILGEKKEGALVTKQISMEDEQKKFDQRIKNGETLTDDEHAKRKVYAMGIFDEKAADRAIIQTTIAKGMVASFNDQVTDERVFWDGLPVSGTALNQAGEAIGVKTFGRDFSRNNFARFYMMSKGYSFEDTLSQDPKMLGIKRELGEQLQGIILGEDKMRAKHEMADLANFAIKFYGDEKNYPKTDISSDYSIAENYRKNEDFRRMQKDISQALFYGKSPYLDTTKNELGTKTCDASHLMSSNFEHSYNLAIDRRKKLLMSDDFSTAYKDVPGMTPEIKSFNFMNNKPEYSALVHGEAVRDVLIKEHGGSLTLPNKRFGAVTDDLESKGVTLDSCYDNYQNKTEAEKEMTRYSLINSVTPVPAEIKQLVKINEKLEKGQELTESEQQLQKKNIDQKYETRQPLNQQEFESLINRGAELKPLVDDEPLLGSKTQASKDIKPSNSFTKADGTTKIIDADSIHSGKDVSSDFNGKKEEKISPPDPNLNEPSKQKGAKTKQPT